MTPSTHEALVRAREALGPFAQAADAKEAEPWPGRSAHDDTKYSVAVGHLRAARSALALLDTALLHDPKASEALARLEARASEPAEEWADRLAPDLVASATAEATTAELRRELDKQTFLVSALEREREVISEGASNTILGLEATIAELRKGWRDDERQYERRLAELAARLAEAEGHIKKGSR